LFQYEPSSRLGRATLNQPKEISMKKLFVSIALTVAATGAFAGTSCNVPQDKWMNEGDFKAGLEAQGYQIKTFKVSKGKCYEIYGFDKAGKKVEIYFNPETGAAL
jgi:hypothetical protein